MADSRDPDELQAQLAEERANPPTPQFYLSEIEGHLRYALPAIKWGVWAIVALLAILVLR